MPSSPNAQPLPQTPNVIQPRHNRGADLLVGGVVGYLIGRRRGRINTEERMVPIQQKLEREVSDLHSKITERESKIRELVSEKVKAAPEQERPQAVEKIIEKVERRETDADRPVFEKAAEVIRRTVFEGLENVLVPVETALSPEKRKDPESMTVNELLEVARSIQIENASLKSMYEAGRIDAVGLRRVVLEYLRGGDHERLLADYLGSLSSPERLRENRQDDVIGATGVSGSQNNHGTAPQPIHRDYASKDIKPARTPISDFSPSMKEQVKSRLIVITVLAIVGFLILVALL